jgi:hypothetical protein
MPSISENVPHLRRIYMMATEEKKKLNIYLIISEYKLDAITRDIPLSPTQSNVFCLRSL